MSSPTGSPQASHETNSIRRSLMLSWGRRDDAPDRQHTARVHNPAELEATLGTIHQDGIRRGLAQQVNIWIEEAQPDRDGAPVVWSPTRPEAQPGEFASDLPEPFIEAIIGDPQRAGLRWLAVDAQVQAMKPVLPELNSVEFDNGGAVDPLPASVFRLTFDDVLEILRGLLNDGQRSNDYSWAELAFPDDES